MNKPPYIFPSIFIRKSVGWLVMIFACGLCYCTEATETKAQKQIVTTVFEALNQNQYEEIVPFLADDFQIANQKGEVAKLVLQQVISQLTDSVQEFHFVKTSSENNLATCYYDVVYQNLGNKQAFFTFNSNDQLTELSLFQMQVKTMESSLSVQADAQKIVTIPFEMANHLILVKAEVDGQIQRFLFDSGAPTLVLNSHHYASSVPENGQKIVSGGTGVGGNINDMDVYHLQQFDWAGIHVENQDVLMINLHHLEEELEQDIAGLIGYSVFRDYDLLFDYKQQQLTLIPASLFMQYQQQFLTNRAVSVPFTLSSHIPVLTGQVNGQELVLGLDCGAETNLINAEDYQRWENLLEEVDQDTLSGASEHTQTVISGTLPELQLGAKRFSGLCTVVSDISHLNNGYQLELDGLIGYEVLHTQKNLLSFSTKTLFFLD